jgi:DNA invertase Pin-like site-specific DNA recombinase
MSKAIYVGYARVSTKHQSLKQQVDRLHAVGCNKVFKEQISGVSSTRDELENLLNYVREGDSLVVTRLDRLARSAVDLGNIAKRLEQKRVDLIVLDQSIDTSTAQGKLMFNMIAAFAEFERELITERCREGIEKAKEKGVKFGRKRKLTDSQVSSLVYEFENRVMSRLELADKYSISVPSLYRIVVAAKSAKRDIKSN